MTDLWDSVLKTAEQQRAKGMEKYGKPVTADAATDWCQHAIEEQLDSAVYMRAVKELLKQQKQDIEELTQNLQVANTKMLLREEDYANLRASHQALVKQSQEKLDSCAKALTTKESELEAANAGIHKLAENNSELAKEVEKWKQWYDKATAAYTELATHYNNLQQKNKAFDKQQKEATEWASVAKRLRTELQNAETICKKLQQRLTKAGDLHWLVWLAGVAVGAAVTALFAL